MQLALRQAQLRHIYWRCAFFGKVLLVVMALVGSSVAVAVEKENLVYLELEYGRVVIETRPDLAPNHVARIKELVGQGFYDGIRFHRVIDGFMAQTGDPNTKKDDLQHRWGTGGSGQNIAAEFSNSPHVRGTVSMARSNQPNSADSQFFIVFAPAPFLDNKYTVWGRVIEGMEFVDQIKKGAQDNNGSVDDPDRIVRMYQPE